MTKAPLDRGDLNRAVDSLKEHINEKFEAQQKYDKEVHRNISYRIDQHETDLHGNGDAGLIKNVDRIQTSYKTVKKMLVGFSVLISSVLAIFALIM